MTFEEANRKMRDFSLDGSIRDSAIRAFNVSYVPITLCDSCRNSKDCNMRKWIIELCEDISSCNFYIQRKVRLS